MIDLRMADIFNFSTIEKKTVMKVWATKYFIKDKMTRRIDMAWMIVWANFKKVKLKSRNPKKHHFWKFSVKFIINDVFRSCDFILNFFHFFKNVPEYIVQSGHFVFHEICVARFYWVELHLDVILEALQVVGSKFLY